MHVDCYIGPFTKVNQKWIKNLTVKPETLKPQNFLYENREKNFPEYWC